MNPANKIRNRRKSTREAALEKRKYIDKAKLIIESLIYGEVDESTLVESLKHINQSHYDDVVAERTLYEECGYPLCCNELCDVPNKKYHIDSKLNKVFDITKRKNYCSNKCYIASEYLKNQLSTDAVWMINTNVNKLKLLDIHDSNDEYTVGEEVDVGDYNDLSGDENFDTECKKEFVNKSIRNVKESLSRIEKCLNQWFTVSTLNYLLGKNTIKQLFKQKITTDDKEGGTDFSDAAQREKYLKIYKKLHLSDIKDDDDRQTTNSVTDELKTDYKQLQQEMKTMIARVRSLYLGTCTVIVNDDVDDSSNIMPLINQDQLLFRQKIMSDKLRKVLLNLTTVEGVEYMGITREILNLIQTFSLTAENIILTAGEWNFVGFALFYILSVKNQTFKQYFALQSVLHYQETLFRMYNLDSEYLTSLYHKLTDFDFITEKYLKILQK